jgi:hypothetical protein
VKRKKLILFFIFLFALSNTGVPIALHVCKVMGVVSLSECKMHQQKDNQCPLHSGKNQQAEKPGCCDNKLVLEHSQEDYIKIVSDHTPVLPVVVFVMLPADETVTEQSYTSSLVSFSDILSDEPIYIKNSVFLI